ncbi:MAG: hypothetical protein WCA38_12210 [Candidatus Acidiferrales bacterium]
MSHYDETHRRIGVDRGVGLQAARFIAIEGRSITQADLEANNAAITIILDMPMPQP